MKTDATEILAHQLIEALSNRNDSFPEKKKTVYAMLENALKTKMDFKSELAKQVTEMKSNKENHCIQAVVNTLCAYIGAQQIFIGRLSAYQDDIFEVMIASELENSEKIKYFEVEGTPLQRAQEMDILVCTDEPLKAFPGLRKVTIVEPSGLIQYVHKKTGDICLALFDGYAVDIVKTEELLEFFIPDIVMLIKEKEENVFVEQNLARYKHIVETLSEYIVISKIVNGKGVDIMHSDACQKVTGYSKDDYKNDPDLWLNMIYEADKRYVTEQITKIMLGIDSRAFEHRIYHKDGSIKWIRNTPVLFYNAMHEPVEYVAVINDISDLKQVELKMIDNEKQYKMLFNEMNSGFALHQMIYDKDGKSADYRFIEVNHAYEKLTGLQRLEIIGKRVLEVLPGLDKEWIERYGEVAKTGVPDTFIRFEPILDKHYEVVAYSPGKDLFAVVFSDVSDRIKTRKELEESEKRYRNIVELSPDAIIIFTGEVISYANSKAINLFGFSSAEDMQGRNVKDFFSLTYIDEVNLNIVNEFENKLPGRVVEEQIKKQDGSFVEVEISAAPISILKNDSIQLIIRDISRRKHTEAALVQSEERFLMAMDAVNDGVFEWNLRTNEVYYSPRNYNMLGYAVNEFEPKHAVWENMIHEEDKATNLVEFQKHLRGESDVYELEYRVRTKSGLYKWISERGKIIERDKIGNPLRIIGIHSDIDNRKVMEENLRNESEFINNLMNIAPVGIFIVTIDGKIPFANDLAEKMIGLAPGEDGSYQVPQYKIYDADGKEVKFQDLPIYNAFKGKTAAVHQRFWYEWNGKRIFLETNMRPSVSLYQNKEGFIFAVSDITNQVDTENKLRQAKDKAEESDRLKSAFLANMSHEIRTPMNGIIGFSTLLAKPDLTQDKRESYLNIVQNSANQLLSIINDILDISKIEAGQMQIDHSHLKLNDLLDSLHLQFIKDKKDKGKEHVGLFLKKGLSDEASHIISDKIRIGQILSNLLGNAIKFTEKGSIEFGYTINSKWIEFYIRDTGIGIPSEKGKLIFERFRQIDETSARTFGGTGLGLSISKGIVDLMKGKIWFESEMGVGTVFYFTVPYNPLKNGQQAETAIVVQGNEGYSLEGYEVLVVEDVKENFYLLREILEEAGARTLYASDGETGFSILKNTEKIDFILLDIRLPDINGYDLARQIKKEKPDVPIIAQTAYGLSGDREKALAAGCVDYISKPIVAEELMKVIKRNINQ